MKDIRTISLDELKSWMAEQGEKPFRAKQIYEWLWKKSALSFEEMSNLSKSLRDLLAKHFVFNTIKITDKVVSVDGTIKVVFELYDNRVIEGVLIPSPQKDRMTACISSQVGCALACAFCATGTMGKGRNLDPGEIYDQVTYINSLAEEHYGIRLTNIVMMGMGEPLLNYKNVLQAIHHITGENGLNIASRRLTMSTAGITKMIRKLGDDAVKFNLALSLHGANDKTRSKIMPINDTNSIDELIDSLRYFQEKTKNNITLEYILFKGINDSIEDAKQLEKLLRRVTAKVNIIEYNLVPGLPFKKGDPQVLKDFTNYLLSKGANISVRRSRGKDIDAACGQLASKNK